MGVQISFKDLEEKELKMRDFSIMLALYYNTPYLEIKNNIIDDLKERDIVIKTEKGCYLTKIGIDIVREMLIVVPDVNSYSINALAEELREIYPTGKKEGTNYYWRGNCSEINKKLDVFFAKYPEVKKEDVLRATANYVESFKNDRTYMQLLKYFIEKNGESMLLTYVENLDSPDEITRLDWTSQLK